MEFAEHILLFQSNQLDAQLNNPNLFLQIFPISTKFLPLAISYPPLLHKCFGFSPDPPAVGHLKMSSSSSCSSGFHPHVGPFHSLPFKAIIFPCTPPPNVLTRFLQPFILFNFFFIPIQANRRDCGLFTYCCDRKCGGGKGHRCMAFLGTIDEAQSACDWWAFDG